ncbi:MAG: signal peptidase I [Pseudomonadota bacterium]
MKSVAQEDVREKVVPHQAPARKSTVREYAEAIIMAVLLALFIRTFIVQAFKIPSGSMRPTLLEGDHILVNKFLYGVKMPFVDTTLIPLTNPKRGDVVVFAFPEDPSKDFIKRVVATEGETVEIHDKKVFINGKAVEDPHASFTDPRIMPAELYPRDNIKPRKVPKGHIFVMGDNRDGSYDSRFWGFVPLEAVRGKAFILYWSWKDKEWSVRWDRLADFVY